MDTEVSLTMAAMAHGVTKLGANREPPREDRERWLELLDRLDLDAITDRFMEAVREVPEYKNPLVPFSEIRRTATRSFGLIVETLRTGDSTQLVLEADEVGASRAKAEIPMAALMTAIRLDFVMLWDALVAAADASDASLLLRHALVVWRVVDNYARDTQESYLRVFRQKSDLAALSARVLLAELFEGDAPTPERQRVIASELGFAEDACLTVAVGSGKTVSALTTAVNEIERHGLVVHTYIRGHMMLAFFLASSPLSPRAIKQLSQIEVGLVEEVRGIAKLRDAVALATRLSELADPGTQRAKTPERDWARLVRQHLAELKLDISDNISAALAECGHAERHNLEAAVRAYLSTGNVNEAAAASFCHRNTLTNRLRRFHELTGIDVTVPEQAAQVVVSWL